MKFVEDLTAMTEKNGTVQYFVKIVGRHLLCWKERGPTDFICQGVRPFHFSTEELQRVEIWDKLSESDQKIVADHEKADAELAQNHTDVTNDRMKQAREARKRKYENIPSTMVCTKCSITEAVVPSAVAAKCRKKDILLDSFISSFECRTCNPPVRGKQIAPEYRHLPKVMKLTCSKDCGYEKDTPRSTIIAQSKKKDLSIDDYMAKYECQKCNPTKGRGRKGKGPVSNEENPYKIQCCDCKDWKGTTTDQVAHLAKKKKWDEEKVRAQYVCKTCDSKRPDSKKFRKRKKKA